jgi:pyridoxamine 5'-phosphate oxidase family protein
MSIFSTTELTYLAEQKLGRLATKAPDGTLQNNPVGAAPRRSLSWGLGDSSSRRNVARGLS